MTDKPIPPSGRLPIASRLSVWIVFFAALATYSAFFQQESPNSTSRLGWILNALQNGDLSLSGYADFTIDKSIFDHRFYSDKAPGLSLLAAPIIAVFTSFRSISPQDFGSLPWIMLRYGATLSTVGILSAFAASLLFRDNLRRHHGIISALFSTALFAIGSPIFGWSTLLFGHAAIAALLIISFILSESAINARRYVRAAFSLSLPLGLAAIIEYTSIIPSAILTAYAFFRILRTDLNRREIIGFFVILLVTGIIMISPVLIYNSMSFGSPFRIGYGYVAGFDQMKSGFYGIGIPDIAVMVELLFGTYRGLFWICPAIITLGLALIYGLKRSETRSLSIIALIIFLYYLALNSGYAYWNGGFSTGPRHLVPALALPILVLARVWNDLSTPTQWLSTLLLVQSIIINLAATSVLMMAPYWLENPILAYILPYFFQNPEWRSLILIGLWGGTGLVAVKLNAGLKDRLNGQPSNSHI